MKQLIEENHRTDDNGRPAGGWTGGCGIDIQWQDGPLAVDGERKEPNGAFVEGVIQAALGRLQFYNSGEFHSLHNAVAIGYLKAALEVLEERTRERTARGVEGTHTP